MAYKSDTIAATINRLNMQYFLPAIQREFVWHPDQIVRLFDSIMRGYLKFDKFEEFIAARERLIRERLNQLFSSRAHEVEEQPCQRAV